MTKSNLGRALAVLLAVPLPLHATGSVLLGWNNLGMHCMDSDYSVFSVLPPYNTIEAQLIVNGQLVTNGSGYTVTYEAVADSTGSLNSTSVGKGNFYGFTHLIYGAVPPDMGLAGWAMPGLLNTPQPMVFQNSNVPAPGVTTPVDWFHAEGIPITPFDDAGFKNEYPLMRLVARNSANAVIATSDIVLPVSDEMDCRACHGSGTQDAARPFGGWVNAPDPERDYRLNILRLHDDIEFVAHPTEYVAALAARGFNPAGLYANVVADGRPILCASCHLSEALPGTGYGSVPPLTTSMHAFHAHVTDPGLNMTLDDSANRAACYRCHPGSETRCLRGAMGSAVALDGSMEMQCQSCHGSMSMVGSSDRVGWFMEPNCQSCHTGTATHNNGQIRYTSVFTDDQGTVREAVDQTFATNPDTPATGISLYRFSAGHGGLQCSACHGSTHAEFPASHPNDNLRNEQIQGHAGVTAECTACHTSMPDTINGGPHGMHPTGAGWISFHHDAIHSESDWQKCAACHGADFRGTVLSRTFGERSLTARMDGGSVTLNLFQGAIIGCYNCHNGPKSSNRSGSAAPVVQDVSASTSEAQPVALTLPVSGTGATLRIIAQPVHGTVGLAGDVATYFPEPGFLGTDTFTFAAYNGAKNSQLATGTVEVGGLAPEAPVITLQPASQTVISGAGASFSVTATGTAPLHYQWQKEGADLEGATSDTLTLTAVGPGDAGNYQVVVWNTDGTVISDTAVLTVIMPPVITQQPVSQTVPVGAGVTFSVTASGTGPFSYQWRRNGFDIGGANAATLTFPAVATSDAGTYRVVVENLAGFDTSDDAVLTVNEVPSMTVVLTSPEEGAVYTDRDRIRLTATVTPSGNVRRVDFFDGASLLGSDSSAPYGLTVRRLGSGTHEFTARATSLSGETATSDPVQVSVTSRNSTYASRTSRQRLSDD